MAFKHVHYDVEIKRHLDAKSLADVGGEDASEGAGLGINRQYRDLRDLDWVDVSAAINAEAEWIARLTAADDIDEAAEELQEYRDDDFEDPLWGLDIGVGALAIAISACRGVPFASCNAGALGGRHSELHPLVMFKLPSPVVATLMAVAESTDTGIAMVRGGDVMMYARSILDMHNAAKALYERRSEIDALFS